MSKTANINNSIYEFELALVNTKSGEEIYLPIPKGAIEYLEIEDNIANFGLIGKCRIANFYNILQQLKVMDVNGMNCMYISIKNADFDKLTDDSKTSIDFLSMITRNAEASTNIIDKSINFDFEDYFIARTKVESIVGLTSKLEGGFTQTPAISGRQTPARLIYELFKLCNKESVSDLSKETEDFKDKLFILDGQASQTISLSNLYDGNKVKSIFDLISELYKYCSYTGHGPAIISTTNIKEGDIVKRKITLQPLSNYTSKFYELYESRAEDLSRYVTEEFIVGDSDSNSALNTNFIDSYNFIRVDQDDVLRNKWIDYIISSNIGEDLTNIQTKNVLYSDVRSYFSKWLLNGLPANLPERSYDEKINTQVVLKKILESSDTLTTTYIENTLVKSFIYDNTAITFTVQGNTYREAGKFIRIKLKANNASIDTTNTEDIDGYWFILNVKHIFKGDFYTNEYVCVKLHAGNANPKNLVDMMAPNLERYTLPSTRPQVRQNAAPGGVVTPADPSLPSSPSEADGELLPPLGEIFEVPNFLDPPITPTPQPSPKPFENNIIYPPDNPTGSRAT